MKIYCYDIEVFSDDWIVVFKGVDPDDPFTVIHNNNYQLREFIDQPDILLTGMNVKHYDNWVLTTMLCGGSNIEVKRCNDWIIKEKQNGWEFPFIQYKKRTFKAFDLMDDMYIGLSLKAIEGHLGESIVESSVQFDIDRKLTDAELKEVIEYCKTDVLNSIKVYHLRNDYLECKKQLGEMSGLSVPYSLSLTNANLTAKYLGAKRVNRNDGRDYVYPPNLNKQVIPKKIIDFFDQILDKSISDDALFKRKLSIDIGGCPCVYAWGGVHGSLKCVQFYSNEKTVIQNRDVSSLYPSLLIEYNYISRNCSDPDKYRRTKDERIRAKHAGDKRTAKTLKNPLNVTSGAMEAKFNDLYDPRNARSMRISGQLFLTQLVMELINNCRSFKLINFNTDGLMYLVDRDELPLVDRICAEWEKITRFELETDEIEKVFIKDVNNLIFKKTDGEIKKVGGYLNYGISEKGAWKINNNYTVVKRAIADYLMDGKPVEQTINEEKDIFTFQIIAKTGDTYHGTFHEVDDRRVDVQKVNRVYASKDPRYGTIKKTKKDGRIDKIASLPDHCIIDNDNKLSIDQIDKSFYIDMAYKMIGDYLGYMPERNLEKEIVEMESKNVYAKLIEARQRFLSADVKKTGVNRFAEFKYFELADIVPPATAIFKELGLVFLPTFEDGNAIGTLVNTDAPEEKIVFKSPMRELSVISATGKNKMNELQGLGAEETYQRRYLYMMCLDIVEADAFDATSGQDEKPAEKKTTKKTTKPATPQEREQAKDEIVAKDGLASDIQIKSIKQGLKKLRDKDETKYLSYITTTLKATKSELTKKQAEDLLIEIGQKVAE